LAFSSASWRMNRTICWICLETSASFISDDFGGKITREEKIQMVWTDLRFNNFYQKKMQERVCVYITEDILVLLDSTLGWSVIIHVFTKQSPCICFFSIYYLFIYLFIYVCMFTVFLSVWKVTGVYSTKLLN